MIPILSFEGNSKMQKLMLETAAKVMKDIARNFNSKGVKAEAGIIMVLQGTDERV